MHIRYFVVAEFGNRSEVPSTEMKIFIRRTDIDVHETIIAYRD